MIGGGLEVVAEEGGGGGGTRRHLLQLRERNRGQARLLLTARRRIRLQSDLATQLQTERDSNLKTINAQLLLLESNLRRRQEELATMLREKDLTIRNQQRLILALASAYSQITGQTGIFSVLANTTREAPDVDLQKILKEILSRVTEKENDSDNREDGAGNGSNCNKTKTNGNVIEKEISTSSIGDKNAKPIKGFDRIVEENNEEEFNDSQENAGNVLPKNEKNSTVDNETIKKSTDNIENNEETLLISDTTSVISDKKQDTESVTDTDSAIMLEDTCSDSLVIFPFMHDGVKVIRSVSDALECAARPLQLPANLIDSASTTPVNSPPTTPRGGDGHSLPRSCFSGTGSDSMSTTPSCSSGEESDASPSCSLSKARSSSIQTLLDVDTREAEDIKNNSNRNKPPPFTRSFSENSELMPVENLESHSSESSLSALSSENLTTFSFSETQEHLSSSASSSRSFSVDHADSISSLQSLSLCPQYDDSDSTLSEGESDSERYEDVDPSTMASHELALEAQLSENSGTPDRRLLLGSYEKLSDVGIVRPYSYKKKPDELIQVTYNRVMSNHRSVTKVKDVKYRRINKAKSRSLEELRGKLRLREGKPLISVSIGHSYA